MFITQVQAYEGGVELSFSVRHNLSLIPLAEHNFQHNILVSQVMLKSTILYF